jgi:hypothetical protein
MCRAGCPHVRLAAETLSLRYRTRQYKRLWCKRRGSAAVEALLAAFIPIRERQLDALSPRSSMPTGALQIRNDYGELFPQS